MLKFITKVLGKKTYRLYLNPDTNEYQRKQDLRSYVKSLGMTEQDWYNDRFLPKDQDRNPIIPICKKSGCNNKCKFLNCIEGYYCACSTSHGASYKRSMEYKIEKYGEDEALRMDKEMRDRMSKSRTLQGYIDRLGPIDGPRRWEEDNRKKCHSLENFIKRYGPVDGPIEFKKYRETRRYSMSLEGRIEKFGEEIGTAMYEETRRKKRTSMTLDSYIQKFGEAEGVRKFNELYDTRSNSHSIDNYKKLYGEEEGARRHSEWVKNMSYSGSLDGYIDRYGFELGIKRWDEVINSRRSDLNGYIRRYGEVEGTKLYREHCRSMGFNRTKDGYILKYGEEEGLRRYNEVIEHASYVRSIEGMIDKYGPIEGPKRWNEWMSNTGFSRGLNGDSSKYSKISLELFDNVTSHLYGVVDLCDLHYGPGDEWRVLTGATNCDISIARFLDFSIPRYKLAIEFDGDYWHPSINEEDIIEFSTGVVRDHDILNELSREYSLIKLGWKILHIKEYDYRSNPELEVNKCINFIKSIVLHKLKHYQLCIK